VVGRRGGILTAFCLIASSLGLVAPSRAEDAAPTAAPTSAEDAASYVVLLRRDREQGTLGRPVPLVARSLVASAGGEVTLTYETALHGFAARLPSAAVTALRRDPRVASVSPDLPVFGTETQRRAAWNLDRSDQAGRRLDGRYEYADRAGAGAHIYVVDTGLSGHPELSGRVGAGRNFVGGLLTAPDPARWGDCEGHGTHVASTAAGTRWGIAKRATVHAVRVLDCSGAGSTSEVLAGLDWVAAHHQSPAVVNLSLSNRSRAPALDAAVGGLVRRGVAVAVAAGNEGGDACRESPGAAPEVLTVAATNRSDTRPRFSNYGRCVDLFAPGVDIIGARLGGGTSGVALSGTSMSAPHVAGALALVRAQDRRLSATQAQERVLAAATRGAVAGRGPGSSDRLLRVFADGPPKARFSVRCDGLRCTFRADASSDDEGIRGYRWQFGRLRARGPGVVRVFRGEGRRTAVLTVVDASGQSDTARRTFLLRR
jgi:serine protease